MWTPWASSAWVRWWYRILIGVIMPTSSTAERSRLDFADQHLRYFVSDDFVDSAVRMSVERDEEIRIRRPDAPNRAEGIDHWDSMAPAHFDQHALIPGVI